MKTADLYIRVSTDEQADKGYSLRSQEDTLLKYCELNSIKIRNIISEDHSAKTFIRPEWTKLLVNLKKNKGKTDLILFTKWDRFSRNASDAYLMISALRKLGVEPMAIEQPLDTTIPENKMMLAVYLTAPEIENDRRALNTFYGIRQAKKEGRWMGIAPIGYVNKTYENGKKYIALIEPQASIMRWVFEEIAQGIYSSEQILKMAREKGLICSKNNFYTAIKNPCYCGKITLAKFKDEEARLIQGQHESLISESLFYKVQDILMGRKKQYGTPVVSPEMLPLRGFLKCPKCTRMLTGSASKGRNKYFYYYHCTSSCGCRFRADLVNQSFIDNLKNFIPRPGMIELYKGVIIDQFNNKTKFSKDERRKIVVLIEAQNNRLSKARELLLVNDIDPTDYRLIKKECEEKIIRLEAQLNNLTLDPLHKNDLNLLLEKVALNLSKLDIIYTNSNSEAKRMIIGSIYPEKLTFDGFQHRTTYVNEAISEQEQKLWSLG